MHCLLALSPRTPQAHRFYMRQRRVRRACIASCAQQSHNHVARTNATPNLLPTCLAQHAQRHLPLQIDWWQFFDVEVFETQHSHARNESARAVHVPYPCVTQHHFHQRTRSFGHHLDINIVGQIKTAICFDGIFKHADNGLILLGELQFALGFEVFEIVCVQCGFESVECDDYWSSRFSRTLADLPVRSRK